MRPVDEMPLVRDADLKARVTGRTATVTIGQAASDTPTGPQAEHHRLRLRGAGHGAETVTGEDPIPDRWPGAGGGRNSRLRPPQRIFRHPDRSQFEQGHDVSAVVTLGLPVKGALTKADTTFSITADLTDLPPTNW